MQIFKAGGKFSPNATQTGGVLKIDPAKLKGVEYRFNIDEGSTAKQNKAAQFQAWQNLAQMIAGFQNQFKDDPRLDVNWSEIMKVGESLSDIKGASNFVIFDPSKPTAQQLEQQQQQAEQAQKAKESVMINYKDAPPDIQRQMEQAAGFQPAQTPSPSETQQAVAHHSMITQPDPAAQQAQQLQTDAQKAELTLQTKANEHQMNMEQSVQQHNLDMAKQVDTHQASLVQSEQTHKANMAQAAAKAKATPKPTTKPKK